jgi:hypothetical protein
MANTLSVSGNTRLAWTLSESQGVGSVSRSVEQRSSRSIANGTGPNQANVAITDTVSVTGTNTRNLDVAAYATNAFGFPGQAFFSTVREVLVSVTTGPTGGNLTVGLPTGVTGVRLNVGGQFHWIDYLGGIPSSASPANVSLKSNVTGVYSVDVTVIGTGDFGSI